MDSRQSRNPTQPGGNRQEKMDDISISKNLSNILRHTAEKLNLKMDAHGYIFVDDLLKLKRFTDVTPDDIKRIVKNNDKQRFSLITEDGSKKLKIRANQGHSGKFEDLNLDLVPIEDPEKYPVVHGTYEQNWTSISKEGLKKMKRVHIHFAPGLPGENRVISGMRTTCDIYIYIDMKKALQDGLKFFMSANNVILSSGDKNGIIAPKYFSKVVHKNGKILKEDVNQKKKLPVGMVVDEKSKNEQSKKKNKGNAEKNSTDKDASKPKKKKTPEENNDKTETPKNSESKKKGKNSKNEGAAEKVPPGKPNENKKETGGKKKGADKSSTTVTENPGDTSKSAAKKKNQDKKSSDKEAGAPKKKKGSEENVKNEDSKNKAKKSKKETAGESNSQDKEASNPKKKKTPQENKNEDAKNSESKKKKKSPKEVEGEKKSAAKPAGNKADTAGKKKGEKSSAAVNSGAKKNAADSTKKTKNQDKKSSDSSKNTGTVTQKAQSKKTVKKEIKMDLPKITPPRVFIIENGKDERLNPLRQQAIIGLYILKQKMKIAYVLISMPGTVFVFDPATTKELLKELLVKTKCQKVMYDTSIVYDLYQQCGIVLYKGPVADIQLMQNYTDKRILASLAEIVGEVCGKVPPPNYNSLFEKMSEKLQEKTKNVMKTLSYVSVMRHLYENYKFIFEKSRRATFTKYNKVFDDATRAKVLKAYKNKVNAGAAAKKPASQSSSTVAPQQKSKKNKK